MKRNRRNITVIVKNNDDGLLYFGLGVSLGILIGMGIGVMGSKK